MASLCRDGFPCKLETRLFKAIQQDALVRFGRIVAGVLASAILDMMRATASGCEGEIRQCRVRLFEALTRDQNSKAALQLQEKRLLLEEDSRRPKVPSLSTYLEAVRTKVAAPSPVDGVDQQQETPSS